MLFLPDAFTASLYPPFSPLPLFSCSFLPPLLLTPHHFTQQLPVSFGGKMMLVQNNFFLSLLLHSGSVCALKYPSLPTSYPTTTTTTTTIPSYLLPLPLSAFEACTTLHSGRQAEDSGDGRFPVCQPCTCEGPKLPLSSRLTDTVMAPRCMKAQTLTLAHIHRQTGVTGGVHMMLVREQTLQINDQVKAMGFFLNFISDKP